MIKLISSDVVSTVLIKYEKDEQILETLAYINYAKDIVIFPYETELNKDDELKRAILNKLDTIFPTEVKIPDKIKKQIEEIRSGNYEYKIPNGRK